MHGAHQAQKCRCKAKEIVKTCYGEEKIKNIDSNGFSENAEIPSFDFNVKMKENDNRLVQDFELFAFAKVLGVSADAFNIEVNK